ncbi:MAG: DUF2796 domain-containing protein [Hyphomonadaceae bacterium]|nr:DUF2796 domain-containing protein [Hyphomonadaceae bacterium]
MKLFPPRTVALTALLGLASLTTAHGQEHGAHVHGEANISVVIEEETVSVSVMSAMYNITGFERAPENEEEEAAFAAALAALGDGAQLFGFSAAAECVATDSSHSLPTGEGDHDDHDEHEESEPEGDDHHHSPYRDLVADYVFTCAQPSELDSVEVLIFSHFANLEKVDAVVLAGATQVAQELTPDKTRLDLPNS